MNLAVLMGKGLDSEDKPDSEDGEAAMDGDDEDLTELATKYMERLSNAMNDKDWATACKVFCRMVELHEYMESQERGY